MANPEDLGRYRLKRLLGRGALGQVWEADDLEEEGVRVAVKIMHAADEELALARHQFAREARLAAMMRHPNVVEVHDAGEAAGTSFMVMEMVEGRSLRKVMDAGKVALDDALRWIQEIGSGLAALHRTGLAHRDLKPENVIVRSDRTACLVDLGIARWTKFELGSELDSGRELPPEREPSPYAPPEAGFDYDELGDQYAWGALAYELLTGEPPSDDAPALSTRDDLPPKVAAILDRARSAAREERWETIEQAVDALAAEPSVPPTAPPAPPPPSAPSTPVPPPPEAPPEPPTRVSRTVLWIGAFAVILAILVAFLR